ncbi:MULTISPECIES: gp53 minor capsid family protein [Alcaligenes]|uniref:Uncharacterized protein n=1 Tax=Alcaligenes faecalis TaxID=511 RepID=A0A222ZY63_ALCFA|nr:hypothetical protein [Alcaligenes faecalis]ASR89193.1 hypothetical protein AFA_06890 [Alcaligenes faecalis]PWE13465.1 hypothetical protein DF183_16835 [Alcaligenes faecalis]
MSRYRRVNIDGKSITETRVAAAALLPGTFAVIDANDKFAQAAAAVGRVYVVNCAYHQGLSIRDAVPAGDSAVGDYVEEGRELAVLCPAGAYKKDSPIKIGANGQGALATDDTDTVIGYSQDEVTLTAADFIRVRMRVGTVAAATTEP